MVEGLAIHRPEGRDRRVRQVEAHVTSPDGQNQELLSKQESPASLPQPGVLTRRPVDPLTAGAYCLATTSPKIKGSCSPQ